MSIALQSETEESLARTLVEALGNDVVLTDEAERCFYATDVYRQGGLPLVVLRPNSVESLQACVRKAAELGLVMIPRGGGASYTDGYSVPQDRASVTIDTGKLNQVFEINEQDATVTVEAGCTWADLYNALKPLGLRTPFFGPFSGIAATVGGSMSQHAISHGSGAHGISAPSAQGMEVVTASGELICVGSGAHTDAASARHQFTRHYGPDLVGLFTGDCGAFGIKARITLPLLRQKAASQCASFGFATIEDLHDALRQVALERLDDEHFAIDATLMQGQIARQESMGARFKMALAILKTSPNPFSGLWLLTKMGLAGTKALSEPAYAAHFILEGVDQAEAKARLFRLRQIAGEKGQELPNTVPSFVQAYPFAPLTNVLGPKGERWVPLHGVLPHTKVSDFHADLETIYAEHKQAMETHGVIAGGMFETVGSSAFLYEIALYWPDARTSYHENVLDDEVLKALPQYDENMAAREFVDQLKQDLIALYKAHGAAHFQIGRAYPYAQTMQTNSFALVKAIKQEVDPDGLMNPGVLGL